MTVVLVSIPREPHPSLTMDQEESEVDIEDFIIYDKTFVPRILLILFFSITVVGVGSYTAAKRLLKQTYAENIVNKKYN